MKGQERGLLSLFESPFLFNQKMNEAYWDSAMTDQQDRQNGLRFSWNIWPSSRLETTRIVVPVGCMYTPLKQIEDMPEALPYDPIKCNGCGAILNPFCQVDFMTKIWCCPFCNNRNSFPPHYAENISETTLPAELISNFTTIEYELQNYNAGYGMPSNTGVQATNSPPVFLFVVDTCVPEAEELYDLRDTLIQTLQLIPDDAYIGLITYGSHVMVHELIDADCSKSFVFRGNKDYTQQRVTELLSIAPLFQLRQYGENSPQLGGRTPCVGRFLVNVGDAAHIVENILEDLQPDSWPCKTEERADRCTGTALSVAAGLLESAFPRQGARIMLFASGPCTKGPGQVASKEKKQTMRSHNDLAKGNAPYFKDAVQHYNGLAERAVTAQHVIDIFACSLDQIGTLEMKVMVEKTGGVIVNADKFGQSVFKESLLRLFRKYDDDDVVNGGYMEMAFASTLEVMTSREVKIAGAIGTCSSIKKTGSQNSVSETEIGQGGTCAWSMGAITPQSTIAIYFDVTAQPNTNMQNRKRYIQFITHYQHSSGKYRLRCTTVAGAWHSDPKDVSPVGRSFDQDCAAALMTRYAVHRMESEEENDVLRWLDRSLIRLCAKFAEYIPDKPQTFRPMPEFSLYPQFMFHLRRSPFLQHFNSSPDESTYYRHTLLSEDTSNSLIMIQPELLCYSFNGPPQPALLDATSVRADVILLLDTFFQVIIFHGETIAQWRDAKYHEQEEYAAFRDLLQAPQQDSQHIMSNRFPVPRYILCDQNKSQARFLMSRLNPSVTHHSDQVGSGQAIPTDDVSLRVFMDHLTKLAVQPS